MPYEILKDCWLAPGYQGNGGKVPWEQELRKEGFLKKGDVTLGN